MNTDLLQYAANEHSQKGEDGILAHIFKTINEENGWCVEFGAWDGKYLSNTHALMQKGWSGVFIEGNPKKCEDLRKTYEGNNRAHCICRFVEFSGANTLDAILAETPIPKNFELLSIDIDGNDYHIWDSLTVYKPKVIVIEYNPSIQSHIDFVQPKDMSVNQGNSLKALERLGKQKGYELVAITGLNAIFVQKELFPKFGITDNSIVALRKNTSQIMEVFQLYDGTLVYQGFNRVGWHNIPLQKFQPLPKFFRVFPPVMGPVRAFLFKVWRKLFF